MTRLDQLFATRGTTLPDALGAPAAAELRARWRRLGYTRYRLLDRGSYDELRDPAEPALIEALRELASRTLDRPLVASSARALRLLPGDYLLAHHDREDADEVVELICDVSALPIAGADVDYRRDGNVFYRFASRPGALSIVARGPGVACSHGYVSRRHTDAEAVRLVVVLRDREP